MTGRIPRRRTENKWEYTSAATAREEAGFQMMEEYIRRSQNTVTQYIDTRSLLDLCEGTERIPGIRVEMRWWNPEEIDLVGSREKAEAEAEAEEDGAEKLQRGQKRKTPWPGHR